MNNYPHIREDKRERVLEAAKRLGYVANPMARTLAGGQAKVIGLLVPDLLTEYTSQIVLGIDEELANAGYDMMLHTTHNSRLREPQYMVTLTQGITEGLLLIVPMDPGAYLEGLRAQQFPYVIIDNQDFDDFSPTIVSDNYRGAYDAVEYLISLGHRRIGFIAGAPHTSSAFERLEAYRAALEHHGITFDPALVAAGNFIQTDGFHAAQTLLALDPRPTALFAANDVSAFGAMDAIRSRGLSIPKDISVVGFDDIPRASQVYPALTSVRQSLQEMGQKATQLLLRYINDPGLPTERIVLDTQLVVRDSCQPLDPPAG